jgi:hypothetical protein
MDSGRRRRSLLWYDRIPLEFAREEDFDTLQPSGGLHALQLRLARLGVDLRPQPVIVGRADGREREGAALRAPYPETGCPEAQKEERMDRLDFKEEVGRAGAPHATAASSFRLPWHETREAA